MQRRWIYAAVAVAALAAAALFVLERPLAVELVKQESDVVLRVYGLGTVEARVLSKVGFEVNAALVSLSADVGDKVKKGQLLATLHAAEQEARLARAHAGHASVSATLVRAEALVQRAQAVLEERKATNVRQQALAKRDAVSVQKAEESRRDLSVAQADLAVATADMSVVRAQIDDAAATVVLEETLLAHHRLFAPYDAIVVSRHAELGTVVKAGDAMFTLIDQGTVWVQAYIDEARAGQLALGQDAIIRLRSRPDAVFHGSIARIGIESDRVNEERRVWLACSDCPEEMFLGEQAEVRITTGTRPLALMVPEMAISGFDGREGSVWLIKDGKLVVAKLTFGARDDRGRVEVIGGLADGAVIVALPPKGASEGRAAHGLDPLP